MYKRQEAGCAWSGSPDEVLRDPSVNLVDIVTPTPTHFDLARRALLAGKHVLVEKPMTQRAGEARELVAIAERAGLVLMPGHLFRYHPGVRAVRDLLQRGELGEPLYLTAARGHDSRAAVRYRSRGRNGMRTRFAGRARAATSDASIAGASDMPRYRCSVMIPASSRCTGVDMGRIVCA